MEDTPQVNKVNEIKKTVEKTEQTVEQIVKTSMISEVQEKKELERAGQDLVQVDDRESTLQATVQNDDFMVVNFADKEILLDDVIIKNIKQFIAEMKQKFPKHKIIVSSVEPTNQISATIAKQISLARTLNTRNLIRKQEYKTSDVRIRLIDEKLKAKIPENESGYVVISVKVEK